MHWKELFHSQAPLTVEESREMAMGLIHTEINLSNPRNIHGFRFNALS